jgi:Mrp family chromosome partitioning ATPase
MTADTGRGPAGPAPAPADLYGFASSLVVLHKPDSAEAESIRGLRSNLLSQHIHAGRRALVLCAAAAGSGCTFTATNLAVALSQVGLNTLLVDAAIRDPAVGRVIRPPSPPVGLARRLADEDAAFDSFIDGRPLPNLSIVYAGETSARAQEVLATDRFRGFATWCMRQFDITIVDTPPANRSHDVRHIAPAFGSALLVVRRNRTYVRDLKALSSQLTADGVRIVGAAMCGA